MKQSPPNRRIATLRLHIELCLSVCPCLCLCRSVSLSLSLDVEFCVKNLSGGSKICPFAICLIFRPQKAGQCHLASIPLKHPPACCPPSVLRPRSRKHTALRDAAQIAIAPVESKSLAHLQHDANHPHISSYPREKFQPHAKGHSELLGQ